MKEKKRKMMKGRENEQRERITIIINIPKPANWANPPDGRRKGEVEEEKKIKGKREKKKK